MLRLGTRAERKRMSAPPEPYSSSFSASTLVIDTGTSWMFSTLRWAVTSTASRVAASWACSAGTASSRATATARRERRACGTYDGFIGLLLVGWRRDGRASGWPAGAGAEGNLGGLARPQDGLVAGGLLPGQADGLDVGAALRRVLVQDHQHLAAQAVRPGLAAEQPLAVAVEHGQAVGEARGDLAVEEAAPGGLVDGVGLGPVGRRVLAADAEIQLAAEPAAGRRRAQFVALRAGGGGGRRMRAAGAGRQGHGEQQREAGKAAMHGGLRTRARRSVVGAHAATEITGRHVLIPTAPAPA